MKHLVKLFVLAALACGEIPTPEPPLPPLPPPPPPAPEVDAGPDPEPVEATCASACARQAQLGCELGRPTPEGHECVEVCANVESGPIVSVRWNLECLATAVECGTCAR